MSAQNHPAYKLERERLEQTLKQVGAKLKRRLAASEIVLEETDQYEESMHAIRAAQEALESLRDDAIERLAIAAREPYFGRIDFQEVQEDQTQELYIGKYGLTEEGTDRPLVIDWRAPVASLFYGAPSGDDRAIYDAPDGLIEGILWLKRNLAIKQRKLQHIADAKVKGAGDEVAGGDTYLLYRLEESRDKKLRDIVSTIQQEQNSIIRAPKDRPLIIQGVAGSGKTTVALHRLAYLLYTYRESMDAERMVIFAPNRMFLDYIADVLPELGVGGIKQVTFADWALGAIEEDLRLAPLQERLTALFDPATDPDAQGEAPGRFKGSLFFREELDRALAHYEAHFVPEADIELWPGARIRHKEIYGWFHEQYALYPLNTRKERIISRIRTWAKSQVDPYRGTLEEPERKKAMMTAVRLHVALWPRHTPLGLYKEILGLGPPRAKRPVDLGAPEIPATVVKEAREIFKQHWITPEDLAPLAYLQERLHGLREDRRLDHIVIDEAQDFSPFQIDLLRRLTESDSFTILGDLSQGIHTYAGIDGWDEIMDVFEEKSVIYHELRQSYRTTHEIMTFANQVLLRFGLTEGLAEPVFREGEKVLLQRAAPEALCAAITTEVRRMQERHASVAVVARTEAEADWIFAYLKAAGLEPQRITADQKRYLGGLSVIPSYLTKGLEFDGVIVADASSQNYRVTARDAKLLYVVLTRALHDLAVLYTGEVSPLLDAVPPEMFRSD